MNREEIQATNKAFWAKKKLKEQTPKAPKPKTIAQELHGKFLEEYSGAVQYSPDTGIYIFPDGSQAKHLTLFERVDPYVAADLSTQSLKRIKKWMAI